MKNKFLNKILFLISGISTTILLTNLKTDSAYTAIIISATIQLFLVFKTRFLEKINIESNNCLLPAIVSILATIGFLITFLWRGEFEFSIFTTIISLISFPFIYKIYAFILYSVKQYKDNILRYKNIYLYYCIWAVVIFAFTIYVFNVTSALNYPISINGIRENNIIFGSDVADFSGYKNHFFVGDQLRHPALTIIMMPLLTLIYIVSMGLSIILNIDSWIIFSLLHSGLQAFTYSLIATMIFSMLKKYMNERLSFYGGLLYLSTFSSILFSTMIERFSFEIALLILYIILVMKKENEEHEDFMFSVASLSVISSAAIYPIKFFNKRVCIGIFKRTIRLGIYMLASLFVLGRGTILFSFGNDVQHNLRYAVGSIFDVKFLQYLSFESGIFTAPNWTVLYKNNYTIEFPAAKYGEFADGIIMQAYPQDNIYYIIGIVIILLVITGFVVNRKFLLAQVSFYWFIFGAFLLGVIGLGSTYNEMALYLSYFSWAQIILILMLINKVIKNEKAKFLIFLISAILLFYININTIIKMANELSINYPTLFHY